MNFAEELLSWQNNEPNIKNCEHYIKSIIEFRVNSIVTELKKGTETGKIAIKKFNQSDFTSSLSVNSKYKYQKDVDLEIIYKLLISTFENYENIIVTKEPLNSDYILIFYNNNAEEKSGPILDLTELWFSSIILPDFKKQYIAWHTSNVSFSAQYAAKYSYAPLIKLAIHISSVSSEEIKLKITELAKNNGLEYLDVHKNYSFVLQIS